MFFLHETIFFAENIFNKMFTIIYLISKPHYLPGTQYMYEIFVTISVSYKTHFSSLLAHVNAYTLHVSVLHS